MEETDLEVTQPSLSAAMMSLTRPPVVVQSSPLVVVDELSLVCETSRHRGASQSGDSAVSAINTSAACYYFRQHRSNESKWVMGNVSGNPDFCLFFLHLDRSKILIFSLVISVCGDEC